MSDTQSGFMSALMDPGVDALLGAAQGFGAAAMPSRMPVPLGAVLGQAAGGMLQGARTSQQMQLAGQQIQQAQIGNQRAKMLLDYFSPNRGGGSPFGAPPVLDSPSGGNAGAASGGPAGAPDGSGAPAGGSPNYLMSPAQIRQTADLMAATGQDRAAATLYGLLGSSAGGPGYAFGPSGTAFAVPGGSKDPRVMATNAGAVANAKVPAALATAAGTAAIQAPYQEPVTVQVPNADGTYSNVVIPRPAWAAGNANGGTGGAAPPASPAGTMAPSMYAQRIAQNESGNTNTSSTASTASGPAQFTDPTWVSTFRTAYPQQAQGMSDQQILALKSDPTVGPQLAPRMTVAYAQQNAPTLQQAGLPVTAANLSLAHRFGPAGAVAMLKAAPNAPVSSVLPPDVMQANPGLAKATVSQIIGTHVMKYGTAPVDLTSGGAVPAAGATGNVPPGSFKGPPVLTPTQQSALDVSTAQQKAVNEAAVEEAGARSKGYGDDSAGIIKAAANAPVAMQRLDVLGNAAQAFRPGMTAQARLDAAKGFTDVMETLNMTPPDWAKSGAAAGETIQKEGGYLAAEMTRALGSREAASVFNQIRNIQPNLEMSDGGFQVVTNSIRQGVERDQDLGQFQEKWLAPKSQGGLGNTSIAGMRAAFEKDHPVEAYASRVVPYPVPKSRDALIPNVIYRGPRGLGLWDGKQFTPIQVGG